MTTDCTLDTSVVDWILEHPETQSVFASLGIDCSCAGKSLAYACDQEQLNGQTVLAQLQQCLQSTPRSRNQPIGRHK